MEYNPYTNEFKDGTNTVRTVEVRDGKMIAKPPGTGNVASARSSAHVDTASGLQLSVEEAKRFGVLPEGTVQAGQSLEQSMRDAEVKALAEQKMQEAQDRPQDQQQTQQKEEPGEIPVEPISEAGETALNDIASRAGSVQDVLTAAENLITEGEISESTLQELSHHLNDSPENITQIAQGIASEFTDQFAEVMGRYGFDGEAVAEWARQNMPEELQSGMKAHWQTRNASKSYADVAKGYLAALPQVDPDVLRNANLAEGYSIWNTGKEWVIKVPEYPTPLEWSSAVKAGLLDHVI